MDPIQVSGPDARTLDRRAFERSRARIFDDHDPGGPLCAASSSSLVLDADGALRVCEAAGQVLSERAPEDLLEVWRGAERRSLCTAHARGELPGEHCGGCARLLADDLAEQSPILRDHGYLACGDDEAPTRLLVRLDRGREQGGGGARAEATVARVRGLLGSLQVLELSAEDPFACPETAAILAAVRDLPEAERPALRLCMDRIADLERATALLDGLSLDRVVLSPGDALAESAAFARSRLVEGAELLVRFVPGPDDWFDLQRNAERAAAIGARLESRALTTDLRCPLVSLPIEEQRLILGAYGSWWSLFESPDRPASLEASEYSAFCSELRRVIQDRARRHLYADPEQIVRGDGAVMAMPPLDHPLLVEEESARRLIGWFLGLQRGRGLCAWAATMTEQDRVWASVAERPWLRALLHKAAVLAPRRDLFDRLAALYAVDVDALLAADREFAASTGGSEDALAGLREWLHIDRVGPRSRPFAIEPQAALDGDEAPDLTVLIPSYKHAEYIEECLRSVLAQSYRNFVLRVVDDRSPDDTVQIARSVEDPRIEVRVNDQNLGLGNSVLAALESIDTPFVALLNSDDQFHPERLAACRDALLADERTQVVATGLSLIDEHGGELSLDNVTPLVDGLNIFDWVNWYEKARPEGFDSEAMFAGLLESNFLATSTNLVCRTSFLREQAEALRSLRYCLDWHLFLVASKAGSLRYLPERLAAYRLHRSNTVWFDEERRWGYFLEVNRVAAEVLRSVADDGGVQGEAAAITLVLDHLRLNAEVNPLALYLNELEGGYDLAELSAKDPRVAAQIQELNELAERRTRLNYAVADFQGEELTEHLRAMHRLDGLELAAVLAQVAQDDYSVVRGNANWARDRVQELEGELGERSQELNVRSRMLGELERTLERSRGRTDKILGMVEDVLQEQLPPRPDDLKIEGELGRIESAANWLCNFARERIELKKRVAKTRARIEELREERDSIRRAEQGQREANQALRQELRQELRRAREQHQQQEQRRKQLERQLAQVQGGLREARQEIETMLGSMEWRIGRAIWQKTPLFAKTRRGVRAAYRRIRESLRRTRAGIRGRLGKPSDQLKIAAASTAQFPVISHTFVYQELVALHEMLGADVHLYYKQRLDDAALHAAFAYLGENSTLVEGAWEVHKADYEHFRRKCPERVESLMQDIEEASGFTREELERDFALMHAFSFARRIEEWGAQYVQSYFFYDAALSALVASRVLDIPRGASTYADHMMDDWPLKMVRLHLRTADVVVATSRRIKRELVGIGGEDIADKVIVKPNGVNGERFPFVERTAIADRPLEAIVVSRIEPKKGMVELAESVKLLRDRGRALRVHVIGSADPGCAGSEEYAASLHQRIAELGVGDAFVFHGALLQEQIRPLLDRADLFVAPFVETATGDKDGIPTAILEAMSTGLPVVGTDAGSIPEIFDDGVEGYIVGQREVEAFADAVERFFAEPGLAPAMGKQARERFVKEFDTRATEPRFHERVERAVAERAARKAGEA